MTYHGTGGKLLGLGASGADSYANAWANMECSAFNDATGLTKGGCLSTAAMEWLGGCFTLTPPPGMSQTVYDRLCLKSLACNPYDMPACAGTEPWFREAFPPPNCLNREMQGVMTYCMANGFKGNNAILNGLCWAATRIPAYWAQLMATPTCTDVSCVNEYEGGRLGTCIGNPSDPWCQQNAAWVASMKTKPLCDDYAAKARDAYSAVPCIGPDVDQVISYCDEHGMQGPNAAMNAGCWMAKASGGLEIMRGLDFCPDYVPPGAAVPPPPPVEEQEATPEELFFAPPVSEEAAPEAVFEEELPPMPTVQACPWGIAPDGSCAPPPAVAPPAEAKMSTATMGIIGVLGIGAIVGVTMLAKKKK
jgi:hypothetical protein